MFNCSKQYLNFGKDFQAPSFEAQNAQIAIAFARYMLIVEFFKEGMMKLLGITKTQIQSVVDYVISALPGYLQRSLSAANGIAQAA